MMLVHVSPEASSHGESLSSMKFGARVSEITLGAAKRNVEAGATLEAKETQVGGRRAGMRRGLLWAGADEVECAG